MSNYVVLRKIGVCSDDLRTWHIYTVHYYNGKSRTRRNNLAVTSDAPAHIISSAVCDHYNVSRINIQENFLPDVYYRPLVGCDHVSKGRFIPWNHS